MVVPVTVCAVAPNPTVELLFTAAVEEGQGEGSGIRWHISQYAHPPPKEVVFHVRVKERLFVPGYCGHQLVGERLVLLVQGWQPLAMQRRGGGEGEEIEGLAALTFPKGRGIVRQLCCQTSQERKHSSPSPCSVMMKPPPKAVSQNRK